MTKIEVEPILRREKENAHKSIYLNLKPPYVIKVVLKPYLMGYITLQF